MWGRRTWHPTPVLLPGKTHGRRGLVGWSPWGREESEMTERFHFHFSLSCIGEGNGNALQYSCLENPRDRGAWWAVVYGVAQSQTLLKRLSSSSISFCFPSGSGLRSFASSAIFTWPLIYQLPLLQASWLFLQGNASTISKRLKMLSKSSSSPEAWMFIHVDVWQNQ